MQNSVNKTTIFDSHVTLRDHTLRQNRWVSDDFEGSADLTKLTKSLSHHNCSHTFQWSKFERRVHKSLKSDAKVRVACGPVFKPSEGRLRYEVKGNQPVPTHFFGMIVKDGAVESYILPNKDLKKECSLKKFKTTADKVKTVAGLKFSDSATSLSQTPDPETCVELKKKYYTILTNPRTKQPYCTVHKVSQNSLKGKVKRSNFDKENDPNLPNFFRVSNQDYKKTGMHKGHMIPAEDCKASPTKMKDSFKLSNGAPQYPNCNKSRWRRLEKHTHKVVYQLDDPNEEATIVSGPLFLPTVKRRKTRIVQRPLMGESDVPIASHFFKVIQTSEETKAYVLRHNNMKFKGNTEDLLKETEVPVEKIQKLSGIQLSPLLRS